MIYKVIEIIETKLVGYCENINTCLHHLLKDVYGNNSHSDFVDFRGTINNIDKIDHEKNIHFTHDAKKLMYGFRFPK